MAYRQQLYISPTTLTDLTVTIEFDNQELPSKTLTLNDFSIVDDELNAGFAVLSDCTVTIQSQGYETKTLNITIEDLEDKHIVLTPLLDYFSKVSDGTDTYFVKAEVIKNQQNNSSLKCWTGTKAEYDAITTKDNNTLYYITDDDTADAYEAYTKSEVDTLLENKADIDFTNVTDSAKSIMANASMPSDTYIDLTLNASGSSYTAPADGWIYIRGKASAVGQYLSIIKNNALVAGVMWSVTTTTDMYAWAPVRKGETYAVTYTMGGASTANYFRFYYAQGTESEAN